MLTQVRIANAELTITKKAHASAEVRRTLTPEAIKARVAQAEKEALAAVTPKATRTIDELQILRAEIGSRLDRRRVIGAATFAPPPYDRDDDPQHADLMDRMGELVGTNREQSARARLAAVDTSKEFEQVAETAVDRQDYATIALLRADAARRSQRDGAEASALFTSAALKAEADVALPEHVTKAQEHLAAIEKIEKAIAGAVESIRSGAPDVFEQVELAGELKDPEAYAARRAERRAAEDTAAAAAAPRVAVAALQETFANGTEAK